MNYTITYIYKNYREYYPLNSLWAANLIAINTMRADTRIETAYIVDNQTGEIVKTFTNK